MTEYIIRINRVSYTPPRTVNVDINIPEVSITTQITVPLDIATVEEITERLQFMLPDLINDPGRVLFLKVAEDLVGREIKINVDEPEQEQDQNVV